MAELKWITKTRGRGVPEADVLLGVSSDNRKNNEIIAYFTFYGDSYKKFTDTPYAVIAVKGNRVYFNSSQLSQGYKLSKNASNAHVMQIPISRSLHTALKQHTGSYILFKDKELGLYYIDLR